MSVPNTFTFLFLICICFVGHNAWDQITTWGFRSIFLYANQTAVWKLTFQVNHQNSTLGALWLLQDWVPNNWKTKDAFLNKDNKLANMTYAQEAASDFIKQRDAMRKFIRFVFRNTIDTKYLTEKEAIRMRDIWWKSDLDSKSNFTKTRPLFKNRTITEFATTHEDFGAKFEKLTGDYYYYHYSSAERLNWTLKAY